MNDEEEQILTLYLSGLSYHKTAVALGLPPAAGTQRVYRVVKKYGESRSLSEAAYLRGNLRYILPSLKLYDARVGPKEIEKRLPVSRGAVHWYVNQRKKDPKWLAWIRSLLRRIGPRLEQLASRPARATTWTRKRRRN